MAIPSATITGTPSLGGIASPALAHKPLAQVARAQPPNRKNCSNAKKKVVTRFSDIGAQGAGTRRPTTLNEGPHLIAPQLDIFNISFSCCCHTPSPRSLSISSLPVKCSAILLSAIICFQLAFN
eukprot:gb/GEZJ01000038.1/.p2 GENE.gb/GEZJ01000038.1/~~gb/GEZJ01000038.1/.p2  ORF type:complete len:124 (-),score=4.63 gb/GEZJ01000038.1/:416-787(-)